MKITGSHFVFRGFAKRYLIQLPAGTAGMLNGRFQRSGDRSSERAIVRPAPSARERGEREPATPTGAVATVAAAA